MPYKDKEKQRAYMLAYAVAYRRKKHPSVKRGIEAWEKRNPEKYKAQCNLRMAVKRGKIKKPETCSRCGNHGVIHGHHADYTKQLEVEWLCEPCHKLEHKEATSND